MAASAAAGNTLTREQNIANVFNQSGNTAVATPAMQKILDTAKQQTAAASSPVAARLPGPSMPGVTTPMASTPVASSGSNVTPVPAGGRLAPGAYPQYDSSGKMTGATQGVPIGAPQTPQPIAAPMAASSQQSQGSFPGQLTTAQIQAEAQARIDKQRAAITGATNAANAARKNVFDYTNQITGDSRTLENGAFNETHDPFSGQTGYAQANLQRNRGIQDTANNNNYQADITANNQKLTDFETLAPEQQQSILNDLTRQERDYGLQVGALTGQLNGQNTMQQNQNNFNNGIAVGGLTGNYTGPVSSQGSSAQSVQPQGVQQQGVQTLASKSQDFNQNMQTQQFAYQQARDVIKDKQYQQTFDQNVQQQGLDYALKQATLANQITNDQAQRAIGYMNANTSQQQANTSQANSAANISNLSSDNQRQQAEFEQKQKDTNYQKSFDNLKSLYTAKDQYTGAISVTNPQALRAAILAKNLSDDETIQMLSDFGLPIKQ